MEDTGAAKRMKPLTESQIQKLCVEWFRRRYPTVGGAFHSVPNGGARNVWTGKILKDEGAVSGVADLELLVPRHGFASLNIEMKKADGKQSQSQKDYAREIAQFGNKYVICRSVEEFQEAVIDYLER